MQYGFVIDHHRCIGCHACTVACKSENDVPVGSFRTWVKYTEIGAFPAVRRHFAVLRCNQCSNAPCVTICPVNALEKRQDGIVDLDRDACIGCKACMQACPYDAIYLNHDTGSAEKCHFCAHRVEQGLEPACAVVCPEEAIIAGDFDDPDSRVSRLVRDGNSKVRRPEQRTGPNVHYLGVDDVSLEPGAAREPETWIWSDRRLPPPDLPPDTVPRSDAVTVLDVDHDVHWGTRVNAYLVTKGLAAGCALLAPLLPVLGVTGAVATWVPEAIALLGTLVTVALLILDLKRPQYFFRLLTRPNTRSWLVKGGWVLTGFAVVTTAILAARVLGFDGLAAALRWPNLVLALLTAIYTAWLFAQCEGRDLWQRTSHLLPHLTVQALLLGAFALLPFVTATPTAVWTLTAIAAVCAALHTLLALLETVPGEDATRNARQAAALLQRIPVRAGSDLMAFRTGLTFTNVAAALVVACAVLGVLTVASAGLALALAAAGLFLYEQAYVRAAQLPPLS